MTKYSLGMEYIRALEKIRGFVKKEKENIGKISE